MNQQPYTVHREHIETSLSHTQGADSDVRAQRLPWASRAWLPNAVAFFQAVILLMVMVAAGGSTAVSTSSGAVTTADGQSATVVTHSSFDGSIDGALTALIAAIPSWLVILVLVGVSALWTARQKAILMVLPLASAIAFAGLPMLGYALIGINGVYAGAWTALALTVGGGGLLVRALVRGALERSRVAG